MLHPVNPLHPQRNPGITIDKKGTRPEKPPNTSILRNKNFHSAPGV
jgi:hypothetical protein